MDSLFFSAYYTSISSFLICRPWKFAARGPVRKYGPDYSLDRTGSRPFVFCTDIVKPYSVIILMCVHKIMQAITLNTKFCRGMLYIHTWRMFSMPNKYTWRNNNAQNLAYVHNTVQKNSRYTVIYTAPPLYVIFWILRTALNLGQHWISTDTKDVIKINAI